MGKTSKIFAFIIAAILSSSVFAYDFQVHGIYYKKQAHQGRICNATLSVTYRDFSYNSYSGDITIPETLSYNNVMYEVDAIGMDAFRDCSELISVSLPNSILMIHYNAFANCTNLKTFTIPESCNVIGEKVFEGCSNLDTIYMERAEPPTAAEESFTGINGHFVIKVPCGSRAAYEQAKGFAGHTIVDCTGVGIEDVNNMSFNVYPNPARETVTIEAEGNVTLFNNNGQVVKEINNINGFKVINVADLQSGVYFIKAGNLRKKLVIE